MTLYINLYVTQSGAPCEEVGIAYNRDDALRWLDDWHAAMAARGHVYETTRLIMDPIAVKSIATQQNLLEELDQWREEQAREQIAEEQHDAAVMRGVRSASL